MSRILPILLLVLGAVYLGSTLRAPRQPTEFDLGSFGRLPVVKNGRIKPLDTVARTTLLQLQGRQRVATDEGRALQPVEWLARLVLDPATVDPLKTFEITHPELLALMHVTAEDGDGGKRYSFRQLEPRVPDLERQFQLAANVEAKQRTPFQHAAVQLYGNITLYQQIKYSLADPEAADWLGALTGLQQNLHTDVAAVRAQVNNQPHDEAAARRVIDLTRRFQIMDNFGILLAIPPPDGDVAKFSWKKVGGSLLETFDTGAINPAALTWAGLAHAWRAQQPAQFNEILRLYRQALEPRYATELRKSDIETRFNAAAPFYSATVLYVAVFLLAIVSWLRWPRALGRSAFYLMLLAFLASTAGIAIRMWLEGRPPVTNLYSSAVFIGWASVLLCIALEWFYRTAIGTAAAGLIGFATHIIAHYLSLGGDTLEMMRAVLDSNFWLATHVIVITVGYAATFVAGALAVLYVVLGFFTRLLTPQLAKNLTGMVYGIVCFATLFSMVGTILGGIWADQSWGRFWGWDPKENGALMIVLWNAVILHARWGGLVKQRGLMNLAIGGNIITGWSWFGTNLLGVGLHSYGFTEKGAIILGLFMLSQLALIALGLFPPENWRSPVATTRSRPASSS
ncbi:cytochrome C biogenesis protein [Opitutaceae bacterium TAV5]|nr:cytochrome C biogenesis protein [Opitutaceae bacterium TAV5]